MELKLREAGMKYYELISAKSMKILLREEMVKCAREKGISFAARKFGTSRNTVRKWLKRYEKEGFEGLRDKSRAPHRIPHKTPSDIEKKIIELREQCPRWGPEQIKYRLGLSISTKTIWRILRQAQLIKKRKKKWRRRLDLREKKRLLRGLDFIQIDVKYLCDIPKYWEEYMRLKLFRGEKLPRYQFTARDVRTGITWIAFAHKKDSTNAAIFLTILLNHLRRYSVDMSKLIIQTDNGSEFVCNTRGRKTGPFVQVINRFGVKHGCIPIRSPTWNSEVERFHGIIEDEFYSLEKYESVEDFLKKAFVYQLYFNYERPNRWRDYETPIETVSKLYDRDTFYGIAGLFPVLLDKYVTQFIGGNHVGKSHNLINQIT